MGLWFARNVNHEGFNYLRPHQFCINTNMNKQDLLIDAAQRLLEGHVDSDTKLNEETNYSVHAPVSKLKRLKASITSIPDKNLDYVLQVIAAHVNNKQLEEIISVLK